jgi:hypothetical protein
MFPITYALGLSKTTVFTVSLYGPLEQQIWVPTSLPASPFLLLPSCFSFLLLSSLPYILSGRNGHGHGNESASF